MSEKQRQSKRLGDVQVVSELLGCSSRHVLRMADRGDMPWGFKIGSLRRWDLSEIERWIEGGCQPLRNNKSR